MHSRSATPCIALTVALSAVALLTGCGRSDPASTSAAPVAAVASGPGTPATASAAPSATGAPNAAPAVAASACNPDNYQAVITPDQPSAGHLHYRVTLTAAPGSIPCTVLGTPTELVFLASDGSSLGLVANPEPGPSSSASFAPGHPVHFDIQVSNPPGDGYASGVGFTLTTSVGPVPDVKKVSGAVPAQHGSQVGPVRAG